MRRSILSVAAFAALRFSFALANEYDLHFYPLEARDVGDFPMLGREMKKNGAPMSGLDITADLERRGMSLNPRQSCPTGAAKPAARPEAGNAVEMDAFRHQLSAAQRKATIATLANCAAEPDTVSCLVANAAVTVNGTCRPGYRCVINSAGVRGCRAGTSGGGGSSIAAEPTSGGGGIESNSPSPTPAPTPSPPRVEYTWYTTTIVWYYYWYYYVWISTIDYTSTRSTLTTTTTTVSAYVTAPSAATSSFSALSVEIASSTPVQDETTFDGPTPTPSSDEPEESSSASSSRTSSRTTTSPSLIPTIGSSAGNDNVGGGGNIGGGADAPSASWASQYRARDALVFAPVVLLLTLVYLL
ncbi:hypothetical protein Dda_5473 [Drechslerella dactyloides]|uniref:Uncharacterized protein n=1 Tax=Drechslerella dactyloides TaxID=74499 RepID=A0AAD6J0D5_DREDA|nr:hypothetical protein Dda_5473 [Drechslerella dactyloides]